MVKQWSNFIKRIPKSNSFETTKRAAFYVLRLNGPKKITAVYCEPNGMHSKTVELIKQKKMLNEIRNFLKKEKE